MDLAMDGRNATINIPAIIRVQLTFFAIGAAIGSMIKSFAPEIYVWDRLEMLLVLRR
jgi:hypothetical protein